VNAKRAQAPLPTGGPFADAVARGRAFEALGDVELAVAAYMTPSPAVSAKAQGKLCLEAMREAENCLSRERLLEEMAEVAQRLC